MAVELPEYVTLEEAARRYHIDPKALMEMIDAGKMKAVRTNGRILVAKEDVAVMSIQMQASQEGDELVSINEAGRRLGIHPATISAWVSYGWIPVAAAGPRRAKLIPLSRADALNKLRIEHGKRGKRLIPKSA